MQFRKPVDDTPELSFVALIDVLLVVLIFFMASTTFTRFADLSINLPKAQANTPDSKPNELHIAITADGKYALNTNATAFADASQFAQALKQAVQGRDDSLIIIHADAATAHQNVVNVMEAARIAGLVRIAFATQKPQP